MKGMARSILGTGTGNWESHDDLEPNLADISLMLFCFYHFGRNEERGWATIITISATTDRTPCTQHRFGILYELYDTLRKLWTPLERRQD